MFACYHSVMALHCCNFTCGVMQNERGISALGVAVGFNQQAVVAALLDKGANIEFQDPAGNTPLHYAAGEAHRT